MALLKLLLIAAALLGCLSFARAADKDTGFLHRVHTDPDGKSARYVLFVPLSFHGEKHYPVILFLHGAGETGNDGKRQSQVGLGPAIRKQTKTFPFITIFPQSQKRTWQAGSPDAERALAILAEVQKEYKVDTSRIYLTGLSMGGFGAWSLAVKYPDRWAAIAPVCGGGDPRRADKIKDIACWCFHGADDPVVPVAQSRAMIKAIEKAGGHPKYTEYPRVKHNSWDKAYGTAELYPWMLEQTLKK
jgi:predicted peptidase